LSNKGEKEAARFAQVSFLRYLLRVAG